MRKSYSAIFIACFLLTLGSCRTIEQISIDYLQPADLSFPPQLRKVAIVNNMSQTSDNKLVTESERLPEHSVLVSRSTTYANGDPRLAIESLAQKIADQNYFDEVVICDSVLRANDKIARESTLSREEVGRLVADLGVDCIIALENLQLKATKTVRYLNDFHCFHEALDVKVYPTVSVYLPERSRPMNTLHSTDSIYWEGVGATAAEADRSMISDKQMLEEAVTFAGSIPVKQLVPIWKTGTRFLYTDGSAAMRDAAVYVRENSWDDAYRLWKQSFDNTKSDKKKMRIALNIAVYHEMKDSLAQAEEWAERSLQLAKKVEKIQDDPITATAVNHASHYYVTALYLTELKNRNAQLPKLKMQMSRFNDDF